MFPNSRDWTIAHSPLGNSLPSFVWAGALLAILFIPISLQAAEFIGPFERSDFQKIEFSDTCVSKQWLMAADNTLQIMLTPPSKGTCRAALKFYFPQSAATLEGISFEARGSTPGAFIRVGMQETLDSPIVISRGFPLEGEGTQWGKEGARIRAIRPGFNPKTIAVLYFTAVSNRTLRSKQPTLIIRRIRLSKMASAPAVSTPIPAAAPIPVTTPIPIPAVVTPRVAPSASVTTNLPISMPTMPWLVLRSVAFKVFLILSGLFCLALILRRGGRKRRILSPLYEINMRQWKSYRDENGVIQLGGFKKLGLNDLKAIKAEGFNTIWVMGIWEIGPKVYHLSKKYASDFQGSPFAIYDYKVAPELGSEQDFQELVQRAHSLRMSVVVDFVPNHMGLDSAWLNEHPEYFIHKVLPPSETHLSDEDLQARYPGHFPYRTPSYPEGGRRVPKTLMVAYGKDPYFYPWIDTAQLDYAQPALRQKMIDTLSYWAKRVDGVRCDMAMLAIREQVKNHRHPDMSWEEFNQLMPHEFWPETIQAVKKVNPHFVFMAETYWSMEGFLQNLGFDYTYNKPLYEAICSAVHSGHAEGLMNFIRLLGTDFLQRSVHFLENHDEERAMNMLGDERQRAAATILCTLPGVAMIHQGQMVGRRERLPVQRVVPEHKESDNTPLQTFYRLLLKATALPIFQEGRIIPLYSNNPALACYARMDQHSHILIVVNASAKLQKGSVFLMPGMQLQSGTSYHLNDLFFPVKKNAADSVQPYYIYPGAKLINQGLYVELDAYDSHIFVVEAQGVMPAAERAFKSVRQTLEQWPLNRVARRALGSAFTRSSDVNLAANPAGRQR